MLFHEEILFQHNFQTNVSRFNSESKHQRRNETHEKGNFIDTKDPTLAEEQLRFQPKTFVHHTSNPSERGGNVGRGTMSGRRRQGDRGYGDRRKLILKDLVPLLHPWRNKVDNLLREMRIDIMKEIKLAITTAISSQLLEVAIAMSTQIKIAITAEMSTAATDMLTLSPVK